MRRVEGHAGGPSEGRLTVQLAEVILGVVVSRPVSKRLFTLVTGTRQQEQKRCLTEDDFSTFAYLGSVVGVAWRQQLLIYSLFLLPDLYKNLSCSLACLQF